MELYGEFLSNSALRIKLIEKACKDYAEFRNKITLASADRNDEYATYFLKGLGNDMELTSCFREALFNSRELLESTLYLLNKKTEKTSREFLPFAKNLMAGKYEDINFEILTFLKVNITYIFHIRKFRNEAKVNIANIRFKLVNDHIEAYFRVPIKRNELELIRFLDIYNKEEALERNSYHCTIVLDEYLPELLEFWECVFNLMKE